MQIETKRLKISVSFTFSVFLALAANVTAGRTYLLTLLFSFLHEAVHLFFLFRYGCERAEIRFSPGGIKISCDRYEMLSYRETFICSLSAPVMNIVAGVIFYLTADKSGMPLLHETAYINIIIGLGNLLPMSFLDGGRAVNSLLFRYFPPDRVYVFSDVLSVLSLVFIGVLFFVSLLQKKNNLFLLIFFVYCTSGYIHNKSKGCIT